MPIESKGEAILVVSLTSAIFACVECRGVLRSELRMKDGVYTLVWVHPDREDIQCRFKGKVFRAPVLAMEEISE